MLGNQERRDQREGGDEPRVKAGVFEFYWEEESIVVWEFRPIDLVPVKQSSLSGFSGEVWSPLRRAGLKKKPLTPLSSSIPRLMSVAALGTLGLVGGQALRVHCVPQWLALVPTGRYALLRIAGFQSLLPACMVGTQAQLHLSDPQVSRDRGPASSLG